MSVSMYQISVPVFVRHLQGLAACLRKAQALYAEKLYDETSLLSYRLYPDMFNFVRQVQIVTDHARNCAALLAGVEVPILDDKEATIADLIGRVEETVRYLSAFRPEQIDGTEDKTVKVRMRDRELSFTGQELVTTRSLPNFYFHVVTAYAIMRHNGVVIGKRDFMGQT